MARNQLAATQEATATANSAQRRQTQEERTAISSDRMVQVAMELIASRGAGKTSLRDICEAAGYSRGLASSRFGTKDAFLTFLVAQFHETWEAELERSVGQKRGVAAILTAIDTFERFILEHSGPMRSRYIIMFECLGVDNEVRRRLFENHKVYIADVAKWIKEGIEDGTIDKSIDPGDFSIHFNSVIFGTIYHWLIASEEIDITRSCRFWARQVKRFVEKG